MRAVRRARAKRAWGKARIVQTVKALLCCAWLACCSAAHASDSQVIVEGGRHVGDVVRTSGHNVPLLRALEEVVPASYSVNVPNAGPWADVPVSWHGGGSLVHVLGEILSINPSLQANIDTVLGLITITAHARPVEDGTTSQSAMSSAAPVTTAADPSVTSAADPGGAPEPPLMSASSSPSTLAPTQLPTPTEAPASSVAAPQLMPEQMEWQMRSSDGSVRNTLERWAKEAGWQFVWDAPADFTIDATATIHGTLEDALRQVVKALAGSRVPIQIVMYKRNRVLRVIAKGAS